MDEDGDAAHRSEHCERLVEPAAIPDLDARGERASRMSIGVVAGDDHPGDAFEQQHRGEVGHRHLAFGVLTAGHRDGAVVEKFVGDVDAGCDRRSHGERTRMEERAVAEVLHQMVACDEGGHADPLSALGAHAGQSDDVADTIRIHHRHHRMAPDPAADEGARRRPCAAVVRTSRTVERCPVDGECDPWSLRLDDVDDRADPGGQARREASVDRADQRVDIEGAVARHEEVSRLVATAYDQRMMGAVVERRLEELLECRILLLDDQHLVESFGEFAGLSWVERHRHQQLEEPDPGGAEIVVALQPDQAQDLAHLVEGLAARGDAEPVVGGARDHPIEVVVDAVPTRQRPTRLLELTLHLQRVRREETSVGVGMEGLAVDLDDRGDRPDTIGMDVDGAGAVGDRGDELEPGPEPARPREGNGVSGEIEGLLDIAGEQDRHVEVDHRGVARRRQRGRLRRGIVADDGHDTAVHRRAGEHGVSDRITAAVESRALAVPDADHAVVTSVREGHRQLAAHHGGRRQFLVHSGLHDDRQVGHRGGGPAQFLGEGSEGRALIPGCECCGGEAESPIDAQLVDGQSGHGLDARQEDPAVLEPEPVGELVGVVVSVLISPRTVDRHATSSRRRPHPLCTK